MFLRRRSFAPRWLVLLAAVLLLRAGWSWSLWALVLLAPALVGARWRWRLTALLLTPLAVGLAAFAGGVVAYTTGTATRQGYGLPGVEYWNLSRDSRVSRTTSGCVVMGHEELTMVPNNLAVELMGRLFGAMPGSYRGPYPTRAEASALVEAGAAPLDFSELAAGRLHLAGRAFHLEPELHQFIAWLERRRDEGAPRSASGVLAWPLAVIRSGAAPNGLVFLVDLEGQRLVAVYDDRRSR